MTPLAFLSRVSGGGAKKCCHLTPRWLFVRVLLLAVTHGSSPEGK